jgi:hypothetical protein
MVSPVLADNDKELLLPTTDGPPVSACQGALRLLSLFRVSTSSDLSHDLAILIFLRVCIVRVLMLEKMPSVHYTIIMFLIIT